MYLKPASASSRYVWIVTYQLVTECSVISCSSNVGKDETLMIFVPQAANVTRGEGGRGPFYFFFQPGLGFDVQGADLCHQTDGNIMDIT